MPVLVGMRVAALSINSYEQTQLKQGLLFTDYIGPVFKIKCAFSDDSDRSMDPPNLKMNTP